METDWYIYEGIEYEMIPYISCNTTTWKRIDTSIKE